MLPQTAILTEGLLSAKRTYHFWVGQLCLHKSPLYPFFPRVPRLAGRLAAMHLRDSTSRLSSPSPCQIHKTVSSPKNTHGSSMGETRCFSRCFPSP